MHTVSENLKVLAALTLNDPKLKIADFQSCVDHILSGLPISRISEALPESRLKRSFLSNSRPNSQLNNQILSEALRIVDWCNEFGAEIIYPGHAWYPRRLALLTHMPLFLSVLGKVPAENDPCLAIVGGREPSRMAIAWMEEELAQALKLSPCTVISGGARGIDQRAHSISLRAGCPTVAFLPSGLGEIYPADFTKWKTMILEGGGAIISEFPPQEKIRRAHFERRNRVIAALGHALFVVEARRRSGSLMTARLALELGRDICVLPSSPMAETGQGTLDLLNDGAALVRDANDLTSFMKRQPVI